MRYLALIALVGSTFCFGQGWKAESVTDPLRGTHYMRYSLEGTYLTTPRGVDPDSHPSIIVRCQPDPKAYHGHARGKFIDGYILTHTVVDNGGASVGRVHVQYRRNDGKLQDAFWTASTDFSSTFFPDIDFNTMMFGHFMPHKEGTGDQTRKLVIGMQEFLASEVVVQFNLPDDDTDVLDSCGVLYHK
jgi:hypothetical protein